MNDNSMPSARRSFPSSSLGMRMREALASRDWKLELPKPGSQAGAWEPDDQKINYLTEKQHGNC